MTEPASVPAAWHPDPSTPGMLRWWDGSAWTEHTAPDPNAAPAAPPLTVASAPEPEPTPEPKAQDAAAHRAPRPSRSTTPRRPLMLVLIAVATLVVCAWLILGRGDGTGPAPSTPTPTANTVQPGSAVPDQVDAMTGNGVTKAQDTAAQMQQQLDATQQADATDPAAAPAG